MTALNSQWSELFVALEAMDEQASIVRITELEGSLIGGDAEGRREAVVPALLEWILLTNAPGRARAATLLCDLLSGDGHVRHLTRPAESSAQPLHEIIAARIDDLAKAVLSAPPPAGAALVMLISSLDRPEAMAATLTSILSTTSENLVRGAALVGLWRASRLDGVDRRDLFVEMFRRGPNAGTFTLFGAAVGLAPGLRSDVIEELLSAVDGNDRPIRAFPFCYGSLREVAVVSLTAACLAKRESAPLVRLLNLAISLRALPAIATAMIELVVTDLSSRGDPERPVESPEALSEETRWLLGVFVEAKANRNGSLDALFARLGVFAGVNDLDTWLNQKPVKLNHVVAGRPIWTWIRDGIDGRASSAALEALASVSPVEALDVLAEAGSGLYELLRPWPYKRLSPDQELRQEELAAHFFARLVGAHARPVLYEPLLSRLASEAVLDDLGFLCLVAALATQGAERLPIPVLKKAMTRAIVRAPLAALSTHERNELVLSLPLFHTVDKDETGALVAVPSPGWNYADLADGDAAAERVIENVLKWGTHRRTPINPAPAALAVGTLVRFGASARDRLIAARERCDGLRREVFDAAIAGSS